MTLDSGTGVLVRGEFSITCCHMGAIIQILTSNCVVKERVSCPT